MEGTNKLQNARKGEAASAQPQISMADLYRGKINAASSYLSHISALWAVTTELRLVHPRSFDHWASSYNSTSNFDSCNSFALYLPMLLESL